VFVLLFDQRKFMLILIHVSMNRMKLRIKINNRLKSLMKIN